MFQIHTFAGKIKIFERRRKKDIVKLQNGEYVSLGKVENILEGCPVVANICVFGNIAKDFVVALICPNAKILNDLSKSTRMLQEIQTQLVVYFKKSKILETKSISDSLFS